MGYFDNKVAVVTGAGSGIGRATALLLVRRGALVHVVDVRADRVDAVCAEGTHLFGHVADCVDPSAVERLAGEVFERHGRVDLLQNGVGVVIAGAVERIAHAQWRRALDLNLWTVINGVHSFVPRMLEQGGPRSHLVNIASVAGLVGFPYTAAYSATKAAVVGLSEALSAELHRQGISVTCVCPGMVRTNLLADGELDLPGRFGELLRWFHDHLGPRPEPLARTILSAVRRDRPLVAPAVGFKAAWLAKRGSAGLYSRAVRQLVRLAPR